MIALLDHLEPPFRLIGEILYGSGLRLLECLAIRIKDLDVERRQIMVRRGKGQHDRAALLPVRVRDGLQAQIEEVDRRHRAELAAGRGQVDLPDALREKMPHVASSLAWQYLLDRRHHRRDRIQHAHVALVERAIESCPSGDEILLPS